MFLMFHVDDIRLSEILSVKMPAGVSWPRYLSMFWGQYTGNACRSTGSSPYYRPDLSIAEIPPKSRELQTELQGYKFAEEAGTALQSIKEGNKSL
ncbi:uncharacterized protein C12orf73 homolog [Thalassophryne amazonica]|uniref:uncharacterized protein C12orf73 homolog n=1 Tax=Thalassophryne amazonica TaxID=390379 RepID=UPI00147096DB|nr:uncharacterized protein C12orf73 homolog [Thalassophryne amazonica]